MHKDKERLRQIETMRLEVENLVVAIKLASNELARAKLIVDARQYYEQRGQLVEMRAALAKRDIEL